MDKLTDEALAELRGLEGDPISDGHGHQCARHHGLMFFDDGAEPTRVCDNCAQAIVADILPALLAEVARARSREAAWVGLAEARAAGEAAGYERGRAEMRREILACAIDWSADGQTFDAWVDHLQNEGRHPAADGRQHAEWPR